MVRRRPARAAASSRASGASRAGRRSLQILLIALGLLVAQGPMLLHLLLVPHTTCEHGELVEGRSTRPTAAPQQGERQEQIEAAPAGGAEHEHCDASALKHRPAEFGVFIAEASILDIAPVVSLDERGEARPVPILSLAPKSSPPTA
jgi:hypothetical protein